MNIAFFDKYVRTQIDLVDYRLNTGKKVQFWVKRDDLIDSTISGNKWRKLKFNIKFAADNKKSGIATFGGAFSNHIAATSSAGARAGIKTVGFIRTHEIDKNNPTLNLAAKNGMELIAVSREQYRARHTPEFLTSLKSQYPNYHFVPEGGTNGLSDLGVNELATECLTDVNYDVIAVPLGSGGTLKGLAKAQDNRALNSNAPNSKKLIGIACVNDQRVFEEVQPYLNKSSCIHRGALFGGYAKFNTELIDFCLDFHAQTGIAIEPIYSGKMFYALCHQRDELGLTDSDNVLAIHTGGLQGICGLIYAKKLCAEAWAPVLNSMPLETIDA